MNCTLLRASSERQFLTGNLSTADEIAQVQGCCSWAAEQVYGSSDFDLAGPAIWANQTIQVILFILFGPGQAFLSKCLSPNASISAKLTVARLQAVTDTVYSTGTLVSLALFLAGYWRTFQPSLGGLEKSIIRDLLESHTMMQNLMMATFMIQKTPANIKRHVANWHGSQVCLLTQLFTFLHYYIRGRLSRIPTTGDPQFNVMPRICSSVDPERYSRSSTMSGRIGLDPVVWGMGFGVLLLFATILFEAFFPAIWSRISSVLGRSIVKAVSTIIFVSGCLFCIGLQSGRLFKTHQHLSGARGWDFGQILPILLWSVPVWHILLTILSAWKNWQPQGNSSVGAANDQDGSTSNLNIVIGTMYRSSFGDGPAVGTDQTDDDYSQPQDQTRQKAKSQDWQSEKQIVIAGLVDENAPFIDLKEKSSSLEGSNLV